MEWAKAVICDIRFPLRVRPGLLLTYVLLMMGIILIGAPSNAWHGQCHKEITGNTLDIIPKPLREALMQHVAKLMWGSEEPDFNRIDDHKIYLSTVASPTGTYMSGAHFALERFAKQAEAMIRAGKPMNEIAFVLGQATHFIEDLNVPLHTISGETLEQHRGYESAAYFNWQVEKHYYPGFHLIKNYKCFAYETAKRSKKYVGLALLNPPPPHIMEITWIDAINDVANLWQSIFYRALGPEKAKELYGIPAPKGEIGEGWLCR